MKKILSTILASVLLIGAVIVPTAAEDKVYTQTVETPYFSQKPVIDGNVTEEEWGAPSVTIKTSAAAQPGSTAPADNNCYLWYNHTYDSTTGTYSDVDMQAKTMLSNLTIKMWFRWDVDNYYMAAIVDDPDGYFLPSGRANIWNGDCLQFRIDPMGPNGYAAYKNPEYNYKTDAYDPNAAKGNDYQPWSYRSKICNIGLGMIKNARGEWQYQAYDMADSGTGNMTGALLTNDPKKLGPDGPTTEEAGFAGINLASEFMMKNEGGKNYYEVAVPWAYLDQWKINTVGVGSVWGISVSNLMGKEQANGYYAYFQWGYGICGSQHSNANERVTVGGTNALILTDKDALTGAAVADLPQYTAPEPGEIINNVLDLRGMDSYYLGSSEEISVTDGDFFTEFDVVYIAPYPVAPEQTHVAVRLGEGYGKSAGWDGATGEYFITGASWGNGIDKSVPYAVSDDKFEWTPGEWHKLGVKVAGETVTVYFDGEVVLEDTDSSYKCTNNPYQILFYTQGDFVFDNVCFYDGAGNPLAEFTHDSDDTAWNISDMKLQAIPMSIETIKAVCKGMDENADYNCRYVLGETEDGLDCTVCDYCGTIGEILEEPEPEYIPGDADGNGKVNLQDASLILKKAAMWDVTLVEAAADIDANGKINLQDASATMKIIAGWK